MIIIVAVLGGLFLLAIIGGIIAVLAERGEQAVDDMQAQDDTTIDTTGTPTTTDAPTTDAPTTLATTTTPSTTTTVSETGDWTLPEQASGTHGTVEIVSITSNETEFFDSPSGRLAVQCTVSGDTYEGVFLNTSAYISNDYDQDQSTVIWRLHPAMTNPVIERKWRSNEEFNSSLAPVNGSALLARLRDTNTGTLYVTIEPGSEIGNPEDLTFEIAGAANAIKTLSCTP